MTLRTATAADIPELVELRLAHLREQDGALTGEQEAQLREQLPGYYTRHLGADLTLRLALEGEEILGTAYLLVQERPASLSMITGRVGTVLGVYVRPEARRRGIARSLMERLEQDAREQGVARLDLKATADGLPLYRTLGYVEEAGHFTPMRRSLTGGL